MKTKARVRPQGCVQERGLVSTGLIACVTAAGPSCPSTLSVLSARIKPHKFTFHGVKFHNSSDEQFAKLKDGGSSAYCASVTVTALCGCSYPIVSDS